ncbi:MAG: sodium:solute symporter family protein [Peptococcaceae bacterium]
MGWYLSYFAIYFITLFTIGIYYYFKVTTSTEYNIAGWNMGFWPIVGTIISTWCGASVFIGWVGMGFTVGLSGFFKFAFPGVIFCLVLIYFFAKPLRRQKLYTLADLFAERYGKEAGIIPSILSAFIYAIPTTANQMIGMSTIFLMCFSIPLGKGVILAGLLMLGFTILGGLPATIITDALQSCLVILGIFVLLVASIIYGGGITNILANTPADYLTPLGSEGLQAVLLYALSVGPFYLVWQSTWQRIFAAKDERTAKNAGLTGFGIVALISIIPYTIGVIARQYVPLNLQADLVFSYVTAEILPPVIGGIVFVGLLAALMTGATSFILQGSSNLTMDFYKRLLNPKSDEKSMMFVSRLAVVIIVILAGAISLQGTDIISLYQWALRLSATVLVLPFLATMFCKWPTQKGIIWSMVLTFIATISWPYLEIGVDHTLFGFFVSLVSLTAISKLTRHNVSEQVRAVYYEDLESSKRESFSGDSSGTQDNLNL